MNRFFAGALLLLWALGAAAQTTLIRNAQVHSSGQAPVLRDVLIRSNLIAAVGAALQAPAGAQVLDAAGSALTPGLFDAYTQLGITEIEGVAETGDDSNQDERFGASLSVIDGLNPRSVLIAIQRIEGLTRAMSAPSPGERAGLFAGLGAVVNLSGGANFVTAPRAAMFVQSGELAAKLIGGSRLAAFALLRESFEEVRNPKLWSGRPSRDPLLSPLEAAALKPVLEGRVPLVVSVNRAADIEALLHLADEYKFKPILYGAAEAHLLAPTLAARKVPVILDPYANLPNQFESLAARADAAAILQRAGVLIAISGGDTHNARNIRQLAGNAVAHGLSHADALAAITRNPARIYGLGDKLGSIEPGKIADLVLWDGDPLEVTSFAKQVFIDGRAVVMQSRQTLLRDRYLKRY